MRFNIAFLGYPPLFNLRRDFILALKCGLEDLGHDVAVSGMQIDTTRFNLLISGYFLAAAFPMLFWPIWALAVLIAISTVFVRQHELLDIVGGIVWMVASILLSYYLLGV